MSIRPGVINIGRPGPWGNPFMLGPYGRRAEVVEKFAYWFATSTDQRAEWMRANLEKLRGKDLWCPGCRGTPGPCHGDVFKTWLERGNNVTR